MKQTFEHLDDEALINHAANVFDVSSYDIVSSFFYTKGTHFHVRYAETITGKCIMEGQVPSFIRDHVIEILNGTEPFTNETSAILLT